jgi:hypothetical protein
MQVNNIQVIRGNNTSSFVYTLESGHVYEIQEKDDLLGCHSHSFTERSNEKEFNFCELVSLTLWLIMGGLKKPDYYKSAICDYEVFFKDNKKIQAEVVFVVSTLMFFGVSQNKFMTQEELNDKFSREQTYLLTNLREVQEKI